MNESPIKLKMGGTGTVTTREELMRQKMEATFVNIRETYATMPSAILTVSEDIDGSYSVSITPASTQPEAPNTKVG